MRQAVIIFFVCILSVIIGCHSPQVLSANNGMLEITETYWRLTELRGKPIAKQGAPEKKEIHIRLRKNGNLEGFAGCNGFGGHFELRDSSQVSFSNIMGTMMACNELVTENKLLDVLRETNNYIRNGNHLMLNKGNKSPMARFEADYSK